MSSDTEKTKVGVGGESGSERAAADDESSDVSREAEPSADSENDRGGGGREAGDGGSGGGGDGVGEEQAAEPVPARAMRAGQQKEHEALRLKWREASRMRRLITAAIPDADSWLPSCAPRIWRPARVESAADPHTVARTDAELTRVIAVFRARLPDCNRCRELEYVPGGWLDAAIRCGTPERDRVLMVRHPPPHTDGCEIRAAIVAASNRTLAVLGDCDSPPESVRENLRRYLADAPLPLPLVARVSSGRLPSISSSSSCLSSSSSSASTEFVEERSDEDASGGGGGGGNGDPASGDDERCARTPTSPPTPDSGWTAGVGPYMAVQLIHESESIDAYRPWHEATRLLQCANVALRGAAIGNRGSSSSSNRVAIPAPMFATAREALQHAVADDMWENRRVRAPAFAYGTNAGAKTVAVVRRRLVAANKVATKVKRATVPGKRVATNGSVGATAVRASDSDDRVAEGDVAPARRTRDADRNDRGDDGGQGSADGGGDGGRGGAGGRKRKPSDREGRGGGDGGDDDNVVGGCHNDTSNSPTSRSTKRLRRAAAIAATVAAADVDSPVSVGRPKKRMVGESRYTTPRVATSDVKRAGGGDDGENGDGSSGDRDGGTRGDPNTGEAEGGAKDASEKRLESLPTRGAAKLGAGKRTIPTHTRAPTTRVRSPDRVMHDSPAVRRLAQVLGERHTLRHLAEHEHATARSNICASDLVRFWDPRALQAAVQVRAGSDGREFRTYHRPNPTEALWDRSMRGPSVGSVRCAAVRCVFSCPSMRNLYCVVDIGALDGTGYAAYRASFHDECRLHLARPDRLVAHPLVALVLAYLPLWMPTREPERPEPPQLPREFSAEAVATLIARHAGH